MTQLWRRGPEWLYAEVLPCPDSEPGCMPKECSVGLTATALRWLNLVATESCGSIANLLSCENFSTLSRLLRVTAYVARAVKTFWRSDDDLSTNRTPEELAHAEKLWMMSAKRQLVGGKDFKTLQSQFNLFVDEKGVWR